MLDEDFRYASEHNGEPTVVKLRNGDHPIAFEPNPTHGVRTAAAGASPPCWCAPFKNGPRSLIGRSQTPRTPS